MAGTQGIGVFGINSKFASGNLVFYEKTVGRTTTGDVLTIGTAKITVGNTAQDIDLQVYLGSATEYVLFDVGNSRVDYGEDGQGVDIRIFGDTASSLVLWDTSDDRLEFDGADLNLQDNDRLQFGDSQDVVTYWDGALYLSPAASNTLLALGTDGQGLDVRLFTNTASVHVDWDASGNRLEFDTGTLIGLMDRASVYFGDSNDVRMYWDGAMYFTSAAANTSLSLGGGGQGLDVTFNTNTGGVYAEWDASANRLEFNASTHISMADNARIYFGTGDDMNLFFDGTTLYFANATQNINFNLGDAGSGLALKLESNTAGHYVQWMPSTNMLDFVGAVGLGVAGVMGATFNGAVTNITVSRGIVTAVS